MDRRHRACVERQPGNPQAGLRPGEIALPFDPATEPDAGVAFIGRIRTPWPRDGSCPKNLREAREQASHATIELDRRYQAGLDGLSPGADLVVLYWMDAARRDVIVQRPRHLDRLVGVFGLRSPARPNPIAIAVVSLRAMDPAACTLTVDAIDCYDGTPLLDLKPWLPSVDVPEGCRVVEEPASELRESGRFWRRR
jgi:tRNA-Thr(GGU) m(6)t(6)A37 methyltransferase TsaA